MAFSGVKNYIITNNSEECELTNFSYDKTTKDFSFEMENNTEEVLVFGGGYLIDSEDKQFEVHMLYDSVREIFPDNSNILHFETEGDPSLAVDKFTYRLYAIGAIDNTKNSNSAYTSVDSSRLGAIITIVGVVSLFLLATGIIGGVFLSQHLAKKKKNK